MTLEEAIAVFDKSADRTRPNTQTEAWKVIREALLDEPRYTITAKGLEMLKDAR